MVPKTLDYESIFISIFLSKFNLILDRIYLQEFISTSGRKGNLILRR